MKYLVLLGALAFAPISSFAGPSGAAPAIQVRTLIDRDDLRSIEVVTDRHESVEQFFGRQKLALGTSAVIDGKFVTDPAQWQSSKTRSLFVSYPLFNDEAFKMSLFGANFRLLPPATKVLALLKDQSGPSGSTFVILAPLGQLKGQTQPARIVGRIQVTGAWQPSSEAALGFVGPKK